MAVPTSQGQALEDHSYMQYRSCAFVLHGTLSTALETPEGSGLPKKVLRFSTSGLEGEVSCEGLCWLQASLL